MKILLPLALACAFIAGCFAFSAGRQATVAYWQNPDAEILTITHPETGEEIQIDVPSWVERARSSSNRAAAKLLAAEAGLPLPLCEKVMEQINPGKAVSALLVGGLVFFQALFGLGAFAAGKHRGRKAPVA